MSSGIYLVTCVNGERYIGSAVDLDKRWRTHVGSLKAGNHYNPRFQSLWNDFGREGFIFTVLDYCDKEELLIREQERIDELGPEINIAKFAGANMRGRKRTAKAIAGSVAAHRGAVRSEATRQKMKEAWARRAPMSEETRLKIKEAALKRRPSSPEHMAKMVEAMKIKGRSKEHNANIGASRRGKKHTPEAIEKMRAARIARN